MLDYAASLAREQAKADAIPRFEVPDYVYYDDDEPETGACWNCKHCAEVVVCIDYKSHSVLLCVHSRDTEGDGEVESCDTSTRECENWELW